MIRFPAYIKVYILHHAPVYFLTFCSLVLQLYAAPLQDVADEGVSVQKTNVQDTVQLLTDEWVLRDHLV